MGKKEESQIESQAKEIESDIHKSEHWANFGTLTSLISTAVYFTENLISKNLPRWLNVSTLGAVGVGIMGVLASYYYKLKAGRIALYSSAHIEQKPADGSPADDAGRSGANWVEREAQRGMPQMTKSL